MGFLGLTGKNALGVMDDVLKMFYPANPNKLF